MIGYWEKFYRKQYFMGLFIGIIFLQSIFFIYWYNIKKIWKDNILKIVLNNNKKYLMIKEFE